MVVILITLKSVNSKLFRGIKPTIIKELFV
nr:MAG TPA: hypothetical protein [Caudoviricetes sp.]